MTCEQPPSANTSKPWLPASSPHKSRDVKCILRDPTRDGLAMLEICLGKRTTALPCLI